MFPIRDHNPSERTPFVTWTLIAVNVLVFIGYSGLLGNERALQQFFMTWGLVPAISSPETFVSSMFLHAGFMHLAGNMLFLWVFGDNLEDQMGHFGFLVFYLAGGLGAAVTQVSADPSSYVPMVGASGAIAGVMGGYLLMFPKARVDMVLILVVFFRIFTVPAWLVLAGWFLVQVFQGTMAGPGMGGVAYWAHAGGFAAGVILTVPLWLKRGGPAYWHRTQGHPPHPETRYRAVRTSVPRVTRRGVRSPWDRR